MTPLKILRLAQDDRVRDVRTGEDDSTVSPNREGRIARIADRDGNDWC